MSVVASCSATSVPIRVSSRKVLAKLNAARTVPARAFREASPVVMVARVEKPDDLWRKELDAPSFKVLRNKGTEPAGTSEYNTFYPKEGHFVCKAGTSTRRLVNST
jgi:hypothetical protein